MKRPTSEHDVKILNSLIETTLDSADGYSQAATRCMNPKYKKLFEQWANERREIVSDLQSQVRTLGGTPQDDGSVLAAGHRMFLRLCERVQKDDESVIDEVERGEDFIKGKYEEALDDEELASDIRSAVVRAYGSVRSGHDQARDLKRGLAVGWRLVSGGD